MDKDSEKLIKLLAPEIENKCVQIKLKRKENLRSKLFLFICAATVIIPTLFVYFGITLSLLIFTAIFSALSIIILSPIIIKNHGGKTNETI